VHGWMNELDWSWVSMFMLIVFWILVIGLVGIGAVLVSFRPSHSSKVQSPRRPRTV
jgi:hypothetical protein